MLRPVPVESPSSVFSAERQKVERFIWIVSELLKIRFWRVQIVS
jgi:hypothetical protein